MAFAELDHFRAALNEGYTSPLVLCPELGDALKYIADRAHPGHGEKCFNDLLCSGAVDYGSPW